MDQQEGSARSNTVFITEEQSPESVCLTQCGLHTAINCNSPLALV